MQTNGASRLSKAARGAKALPHLSGTPQEQLRPALGKAGHPNRLASPSPHTALAPLPWGSCLLSSSRDAGASCPCSSLTPGTGSCV